jgi:hypothetical protein
VAEGEFKTRLKAWVRRSVLRKLKIGFLTLMVYAALC